MSLAPLKLGVPSNMAEIIVVATDYMFDRLLLASAF